ncbi:hypothetical protein Aduo_012894 [Ancylostoma duodenale]
MQRKKSCAVREREVQSLVKLYCDAGEEYHQKFQGVNTGPSLKQMKLEEWAYEVSSLGVYERSEKQIEERLHTDFKRMNKYISDKKNRLTRTGGAEGPSVKTLPHYLMPLYERLLEKQHVTGLKKYHCEQCDEPTASRALFNTFATHALLHTRAKEALSVLTDRRLPMYDEEIRATKLRADALEMEVGMICLELERAQFELERAQMELAPSLGDKVTQVGARSYARFAR